MRTIKKYSYGITVVIIALSGIALLQSLSASVVHLAGSSTHAMGALPDVNSDGTIDIFDLSLMLSSWQTVDVDADVTGDGIVDVFDLSALLSQWGQSVDMFLSGTIAEIEYSVTDDITTGWQYQTSGAPESVTELANHTACIAGGYVDGTHYARVRRPLPELDDFAATKRFSVESVFELPADFYDNHESYMRLITTDNYPGILQTSGLTVGANDADEWRVGFTIYGGDGLFRLTSDHENNDALVLWTNDQQLTTGVHTVKINMDPSRTGDGAWELYIDGVLRGSGLDVQTVPVTLDASEVTVTRVGSCIDGAAQQSTESIQVNLQSVLFRAEL